jgi:hypothetical protein
MQKASMVRFSSGPVVGRNWRMACGLGNVRSCQKVLFLYITNIKYLALTFRFYGNGQHRPVIAPLRGLVNTNRNIISVRSVLMPTMCHARGQTRNHALGAGDRRAVAWARGWCPSARRTAMHRT